MLKIRQGNILKASLIAFFICWALQLMTGMTVRNPLTVVFFLCGFFAEKWCPDFSDKKKQIIAKVLSVLVSAGVTATTFGRAAAEFDNKVFKILTGFIIFTGVFILSDLIFRMILARLYMGKVDSVKKRGDLVDAGVETGDRSIVKWPGIKVGMRILFIGTAIICFLCWLPYFLYEYPGIMTADSLVQYEQIIGIRPYSNHHPIVHTLCIAFFYKIGFLLTGDPNKSIAIYTVAQMVFMSLCCAEVVCTVQRMVTKNVSSEYGEDKQRISVLTVLSMAFFALVPFNAVFAVTIWKDVPFAGFTMLLVCCTYDMIANTNSEVAISPGLIIRFILLSLAFCLFRSNALYAYVLAFIFFLIYFWRTQKAVPAAMIAVIVISLFIKGPLMNGAGIEQADFIESLSVPLQMTGRVLVNDREIPDEDMALIDAVIDRTYIHELYAPDFADNMKELVRAGHPEVIEQNKGEYLGLWLRLMIRYPGDYLAGWFDVVGGYIYPDVAYDVGNIDGVMGNDLGLTSTPLIGGKVVIKLKEIFIKLGSFVPIYGMLWCVGAYTWLLVVSLILTIKCRRYSSHQIITVIPLALIATLCIAAPLVDFRYAYGVVMTMPIYAALCVIIVTEKKRG